MHDNKGFRGLQHHINILYRKEVSSQNYFQFHIIFNEINFSKEDDKNIHVMYPPDLDQSLTCE
ncbi:hypothetical protein CHS0354_041736 [Potamilus streckersoni]|uniref:Uncharacterized protein n=1 Tax=Potamilus streckersoni TaxID=2493646 RepID=A0AAE0T1S2_9BIVA|nr:hypothetical protein CHS0354_041736 [Potamilus streckersoni]